jgi:hypothetical protein
MIVAGLLDLPRGSMSGTVPVPWHWVYFFSESVANRRIGLILASDNAVALNAVIATMMGCAPER